MLLVDAVYSVENTFAFVMWGTMVVVSLVVVKVSS